MTGYLPGTAMLRAVLAAAVALATAAASDLVTTRREEIECRIVALDSTLARLRLPSGGIRVIHTDSILALRVADSARADTFAGILPGAHITIVPEPKPAAAVTDTQTFEPPAPPPAPRKRFPKDWLFYETGGSLLGGTLVAAGCGLVAGVIGQARFSGEDYEALGVYVFATLGAAGGYPVGSALGTRLVGRAIGDTGRLWPALLGSALGAASGYGLLAATNGKPLLLLPAFALPPAGAVLGYNLGRAGEAKHAALDDRVVPPWYHVGVMRGLDGGLAPTLSMSVVGLRF